MEKEEKAGMVKSQIVDHTTTPPTVTIVWTKEDPLAHLDFDKGEPIYGEDGKMICRAHK